MFCDILGRVKYSGGELPKIPYGTKAVNNANPNSTARLKEEFNRVKKNRRIVRNKLIIAVGNATRLFAHNIVPPFIIDYYCITKISSKQFLLDRLLPLLFLT